MEIKTAYVIKVRILKWEDYLGLSGLNTMTKVLIREVEGRESQRGDD